jgi:hypothetical protein
MTTPLISKGTNGTMQWFDPWDNTNKTHTIRQSFALNGAEHNFIRELQAFKIVLNRANLRAKHVT